MHPVTSRRASLSAVGLTILAVGLMLLMIMFAARSGPERIFAGPLHDPSVRPVDPSYSLVLPGGGTPGLHDGQTHPNPFFVALGWVIKVAALACIMWLLYRAARKLLERCHLRIGQPDRRIPGQQSPVVVAKDEHGAPLAREDQLRKTIAGEIGEDRSADKAGVRKPFRVLGIQDELLPIAPKHEG